MKTHVGHSKFGTISDSVSFGSPFILVKLARSPQWGTSLLTEVWVGGRMEQTRGGG